MNSAFVGYPYDKPSDRAAEQTMVIHDRLYYETVYFGSKVESQQNQIWSWKQFDLR